jgi:hypothetical protein
MQPALTPSRVPTPSSTKLTRVRRRAGDNPRIASPTPPDTPPSRDTGARGWVRRATDRVGLGKKPASLIYGVIVIGALMAAESGRHENYPDTVGAVVIALCLYWLAHAYADVLGHRLQTHERLSAKALWRMLRDESAILTGAALPLLALLLAWAVGATQATGVEAALWTSVASLLAFELLAGIRARAGRSPIGPGELVLEAGVGMTLGLAIIALKVVLH